MSSSIGIPINNNLGLVNKKDARVTPVNITSLPEQNESERIFIDSAMEENHCSFKSEVREIHKRNFIKNPNEEHLTALITRTSIYFDGSSATSNRPKYLEFIAGAYEQLNKVPEIRAILKIVANIKNLDIIFDFNRDSIEHADPTGNENVYGKSYAETREVYIGAKDLSEEKRSEVFGVLAHELCHVAMFCIYNNNYKPYHKVDLESEKDFESVVEDCRKNPSIEEIIALVLNGPEQVMHDELCVSVPHLLALYQEDNDKIESLKEKFKKLFNYFERKILQDLKNEIELMSAVWILKSMEPQHLTKSKIFVRPKTDDPDLFPNKILEISSNCPQLTMNLIFKKMSESNILFLELSHLKNEETFKLIIDAYSSCMKPKIVINCENKLEKEIKEIALKMKKNKITERIIFVHDQEKFQVENATACKFSRSWLDLSEQSKENLIKTLINFQGEEIHLEEIADRNYDALDFVPLKELLENSLEIGHEIKFPEIDIHVQRKFLNSKSEDTETSQILNIARISKLILLSDDPGMGKTTALKMLAIEFKKKLKSFWVAFVDLKEHSEFYEKDKNFKTEFNSPKEIAIFFAEKMFKLNEFEERIFIDLFCCDRAVLLLDGFDEISPSSKKFIKMLLKSIKTYSRNILITATRPHLTNELCKELEVEAYTLMPLTEENCEQLIKKCIETERITGKDLEEKIDQTKNFLKKLNENSDPVRNPLLLRMIAKVFSYNKVDMQPNIFSIYENFINLMIRESMKRGDDAREKVANCLLLELNLKSFYHKEAFKDRFRNSHHDEVKNFFDLCFNDVQSPPDEHVTRSALIKSNGSGKFRFIHQTFAEFFVADFLFKNLFHLKALNERKKKVSNNETRSDTIFKIAREVFFGITFENYQQVRSFFDGALDNLIVNIDRIDKKVVTKTFRELFTKDMLKECFRSFVKENLINFITVITRCANQNDLRRIWVENKCDVDGNIFMLAAKYGTLDFNSKLTALAREFIDRNDFLNFFTEKNGNEDSIDLIAYESSSKVFDFYLQNKLFSSSYDQFSDTELYSKIETNLKQNLKDKDIFALQVELEKIKATAVGLECFQHFLDSFTTDGHSIYLEACHTLSNIEEFKKLWNMLRKVFGENDFKNFLKKPNRDGTTPLMFKARKSKNEVFISFWRLLTEGLRDDEKETFLVEEDGDGYNSFDCATLNEDPETFLAIKELYMETFGKDKMRVMLMRERKNGESILQISVKYDYDNVVTVKALWNFIQEICDLSALKTILMKANKNGDTFVDKCLSSQGSERKKIFEPFIEQNLRTFEKDFSKLIIFFFEKIQNGNVKAVCDFIDDNKEIPPFNNDNGESAAAVALKSKQLAVYEALLSKAWLLNSTEYFNEIVINLEMDLKEELREINEKFIENPNDLTSQIDTFLDRNRYVLSNNYEAGKSTLAMELKSLISGRRKNLDKIAKRFDFALKSELQTIHKIFIKNPYEDHLITLIARTSIYFGGSSATSNRRKYLDLIVDAYEELNDCREIRAILKVVMNVKNLNIIFDFNSDLIKYVYLSEYPNVQGKTNNASVDVQIGAKGLDEANRNDQHDSDDIHRTDGNRKKQKLAAANSNQGKVNRSEALGVLAHELCHVAIFCIYDNYNKPYRKGDLENEQEFEKVLKQCRQNRGKEEIIDLVFNGNERFAHQKLIFKVPHLLALYRGSNDKIKSLKETFKKLFDYFERKTLPDLERESDLMSAVWKLKSKESQLLKESNILLKRTNFVLYLSANKISEISSNCPQVTINWIFQKTISKSSFNFILLSLNHLKDEETFELMLDAHSSCMKPRIVIDCDNGTEIEIEKIAEKMRNDKIDERIIFIHNHKKSLIKDATFQTVNHSFMA